MNTNNEQRVCRICGRIIPEGEQYTHTERGFYCEDCESEHLSWCEHCETWHEGDEVERVAIYNGWRRSWQQWCFNCRLEDATICDECGEWTEDGNMQEVHGHNQVCPSCLDDYYSYCEECEEYVANSDWDDDEQMCARCVPQYIVGYHRADSTSPKFYAEGEERTSEFCGIGCEIEIDRLENNRNAERDCAKALNDLLGERAVFERDGSLHHGFEIVTRPHTIKAFREEFPLNDLLRICREHGYLAHDMGTCGFHMHISRAYFGKSPAAQERAIGKCLAFYDVFFDDMVRASRRDPDRARQWANRVPIDDMKDARKKAKAGSWDIGRYSAVNTTNAHTVEFRLMRGTLNPDTLRACIDLLLAIARNAKRCAWDVATTDPSEMLRGIKTATVDYLRLRGAFVACLDGIHTTANGEEVCK